MTYRTDVLRFYTRPLDKTTHVHFIQITSETVVMKCIPTGLRPDVEKVNIIPLELVMVGTAMLSDDNLCSLLDVLPIDTVIGLKVPAISVV